MTNLRESVLYIIQKLQSPRLNKMHGLQPRFKAQKARKQSMLAKRFFFLNYMYVI